jgi:hypothetical protein
MAFTELPSLESRVGLHKESLTNLPNLQCTRCGAHNRVGKAEPFTGPADSKYESEWKAEQREPHGPEEQPLLHSEEDVPRDAVEAVRAEVLLDTLNESPGYL